MGWWNVWFALRTMMTAASGTAKLELGIVVISWCTTLVNFLHLSRFAVCDTVELEKQVCQRV